MLFEGVPKISRTENGLAAHPRGLRSMFFGGSLAEVSVFLVTFSQKKGQPIRLSFSRAENETRTHAARGSLAPLFFTPAPPRGGLGVARRSLRFPSNKKDSRKGCLFRAENETRTRDPNLGKVVLYQLSYFRLISMFSPLALAAVESVSRKRLTRRFGQVVLYQPSYSSNNFLRQK